MSSKPMHPSQQIVEELDLPKSKAHYLHMDPADPQNFMWFYNWILIAWAKQEAHAQSFIDWMNAHQYEDLNDRSLELNWEKENLSSEIVNLLRSAVVIPIYGGYIFRNELPTNAEVIFVLNDNPLLPLIRRMRNLDRFAKLYGKAPMALDHIGRFVGLIKKENINE